MRTLILLLVLVAPSLAQVRLPTGFHDEVVVSGLGFPVDLAFLPDGRMLIAERSGLIRINANGIGGVLGILSNVNVSENVNRGLMAIAVDPQWPQRPYVYVHYTTIVPQKVRIAMLTVTGDLQNPTSTNLQVSSEYAILDDLPDDDREHNGGDLGFLPDGTLLATVGDDRDPCAAQDPNSQKGCLFRLDVSSLPLPGFGRPQNR